MTTAVQHRRGTTAEHATFTGLEGEVTIDTTKDTAVIHDGVLAGGVPLARENLANVTPSGLATITGASTASDDKFFIYDQSATTLKSITRAELNNAMEIDALANVTITGGTINGTTIGNTTAAAGTFTQANFADNAKAIFGAGSDLQIYHDGSNSRIQEAGTGNLLIRADDFRVQSVAGESYIEADANGAVALRYDNALKLATTATGIDVTGTVVADGLTVEGASAGTFTAATFRNTTGANGTRVQAVLQNVGIACDVNLVSERVGANAGADFIVETSDGSTGLDLQRLRISEIGDISFYEDTGTTAKFFWDASAESLGIGTSSPSATLTVGAPSASAVSFVSNPVASFGGGVAFDAGSGNDVQLINYRTSKMQFGNGGSVYMTLDSSGNVGIGTSSPSKAFVVSDGGAMGVEISPDDGGLGYSRILNYDRVTNVYEPLRIEAEDLRFSTGTTATEKVRITSAGSVGIGTSSPVGNLVVSTGSVGSANSNFRQIVAEGTGNSGITILSGSTSIGALNFGDAGANQAGSIRYDHNGDNLFINVASGTKVTIDSSGNLGLGVTPSAWYTGGKALQISDGSGGSLNAYTGEFFISQNAYLNSNASNWVRPAAGFASQYHQVNGQHVWNTAGNTTGNITFTQVMKLDAAGNLGIGTSSPSSMWAQANRLVVGGGASNEGIAIYSSSTGNSRLAFVDTLTSTSGLTDGGLISYDHTNNKFLFKVTGTDRLTIDSAGNVGIGTSSPTQKLTIQTATATNGGILLGVDGSTYGAVGSGGYAVNGGTITDFGLRATTNMVFATGTSSPERMRITSAGLVGIGTSSPSAPLTVYTDSATTLNVDIKNAKAAGQGDTYLNLYKAPNGNSNGLAFFSGTTQKWVVGTGINAVDDLFKIYNSTAGSAAVTINAIGNVGIGISTPQAPLHVTGTIKVATGNAQGILALGEAAGSGVNVGLWRGAANAPTTDGNYLNLGGYEGIVFATGNAAIGSQTRRMVISDGGNVGIGTDTPTTRLTLLNSITATYSNTLPWATFTNDLAVIRNNDNSGGDYTSIALYSRGSGGGHVSRIVDVATTSGNGYLAFQLRSSTDTENTTECMRLTSAGNLGIGTTSPSVKLQVNGASTASALRLNETTSNRNTYLGFIDTSGNFGIDVNDGGYLRFAVNGAERARIDSSGNLLVGTTTAAGTNTQGLAVLSSNSGTRLYIGHATGTANGTQYVVFNYAGTNQIGSISQSGTTAVLYNTTSDQRLKENIVDADSASELIDSLQVRQFDWKSENSHQRYGFVAQELVNVAPEAVHQPADPEEMMAVDYSKLVPMLVKEIQSLRQRLAVAGI